MLLDVITVYGSAGSITQAVGIDERGRQVLFAGDTRPMMHIAEALEAGEDVEVDVEGWAVMGILDAPTAEQVVAGS